MMGTTENGNSQLINPPDKPVGFRIEILTLSNQGKEEAILTPMGE